MKTGAKIALKLCSEDEVQQVKLLLTCDLIFVWLDTTLFQRRAIFYMK